MASVATYLNFDGHAEEAFNFYKSVFGGDFLGEIFRFGDSPSIEGMPDTTDDERNLVMNVGLTITGGHLLMGADVPPSIGGDGLVKGNNAYINVNPDSRAEADRLFTALSDGGTVEMEMSEQFWGDYFGSFTDRFGVQWMVSTAAKS